jgi:hypothetical protein
MNMTSPSAAIRIRPIQLADVEAVSDILLGYPWTHYAMTRERAVNVLQKGIQANADIYVAELDTKVLGFVWWIQRGAFFHSVGKSLVSAAEQACATQSKDMFLMVSDFNTEAQSFYRRLGYQQIGAVPDYVIAGISEHIMYKKLSIEH